MHCIQSQGNDWRGGAECSLSQREAAAALDRRIRLIRHRNPGHSVEAVRRAAENEAAAIVALNVASGAAIGPARLHLRAMQLRAANLDMPEEELAVLARMLTAEPSHLIA